MKSKKNICLIVNGLNGSGVARAVSSLAQALSKLNCRVDIIALIDIKSVYSLDDFGSNIHAIKKIKNPIRQIQDRHNAISLQNKITAIGVNFDLIVSNSFEVDRICKKLNMPNIYYCIHGAISSGIAVHANKKQGFSRFRRKLQNSLLMKRIYKNQKLITVSKGVQQDLIEFGIQPQTIQTIYNPFDINDIRKQSIAYQVKEQNYIVHVGRFMTAKRHDILINAFKQSGVEQKLLLIGDTSEETYKQTAKLIIDLHLQNQVIFKGFNSNPFPYIKNAQALVLSSDSEGFGMVLVEALILGVPIISTDCIAGPSEILIDELKPFLSPVGDVGALAENIKKIVDNPVKITNKYYNRFSAEESAKQYLALCNKI